MPDFVAYFRVSTDKQGKTGLGMDAQREAVTRYMSHQPGALLAELGIGEQRNRKFALSL